VREKGVTGRDLKSSTVASCLLRRSRDDRHRGSEIRVCGRVHCGGNAWRWVDEKLGRTGGWDGIEYRKWCIVRGRAGVAGAGCARKR
jgi:hypothetical protein